MKKKINNKDIIIKYFLIVFICGFFSIGYSIFNFRISNGIFMSIFFSGASSGVLGSIMMILLNHKK